MPDNATSISGSATMGTLCPSWSPSKPPVPWLPHDYQKRAIRFLLEHPCAGLFLDPGLGKTSITLAAISLLRKRGLIKRTLVIAPLRVCHGVWVQEKEKWAEFADLEVVVAHGNPKERVAAVLSDAPVVVINPDGLSWLQRVKGWQKDFDYLVIDESSLLKSPRTKRFKAVRMFLPKFKRRTILTGTPAPNGLEDLFGQIYVLDMGERLGAFITHYRNRFFAPSFGGRYGWQIRDAAASEEIHHLVEDITLRLAAEDYLKMPELLFNTVEVELPPDARKMYDTLEREFLVEVRNGTVTAANAAVLSSKLCQVANGGVYLADKSVVNIHAEKVMAAREITNELNGGGALIAFSTRHDRDRILHHFPLTPCLDGETTTAQAETILREWNAGNLPVLLVHPASASWGINLQSAGRALIWHSLPWSLEQYQQLARRLWRQGREERVVIHNIVARDTIDLAIIKALRRKDTVQNRLLDALKEYAKERECVSV